ncbi:MAG: chemoreceptor glutamine deamidase CheD, partial [Ferrovum sp.]|nr:chemoreceptor glutamine deamidase CheD [Ferrovum sp.]
MTEPSYEEVFSPNTYFDKSFGREAVKILPGEYY